MLLLDYLRYINIHFLPFSFFTADFHMVQFNYPKSCLSSVLVCAFDLHRGVLCQCLLLLALLWLVNQTVHRRNIIHIHK